MNRNTGMRRYTTRVVRTYTGPTASVVEMVRARSGGRCEFPGCRRRATDAHHRYERGMGGTTVDWVNNASNLLAACRYHNDWCSNQQPAEAEHMGWRLRHGDRPWLVPVLTRHDPEPIYLDDNGSWTTFDHPPADTPPGGVE